MAPRTADRLPGNPPRLSPADRRRATAEPTAAPTDSTAGTGASLLMLVFIMSLFVPGTITIGPVNMTVYRLVLIGACIPLGLRWITGRAGPVSAVDWLFLASCLWISLALVMVHGLSRIIFIGTNFVELFGGYLMGRVLVRDVATHRGFLNACLLLMGALLPFVLIEFATGLHLLDKIFGPVMKMSERVLEQRRLGFTRAGGPFAHPIHFGLFGATLFANVYFLYWRRTEVFRIAAAIGVGIVAMLSISSGALFAIVLQTGMILWERILIFLRSRWVLFLVIGAGLGGFLLVSVQGGLFTYIVDNLIFARGAGEHRMDIYYYGTKAVLQRPFFGVGLNEWPRPFWREHPTIDSFWLMTAVRHGIPGIGFLMVGLVWGMIRISTARITDPDANHFRAGYLIALCGLILILSTVHIWGSINVFVMAYFGAGSWFYTGLVARQPQPMRAPVLRTGRAQGAGGAESPEPAAAPAPLANPLLPERGGARGAGGAPQEDRRPPPGLRGPIRAGQQP